MAKTSEKENNKSYLERCYHKVLIANLTPHIIFLSFVQANEHSLSLKDGSRLATFSAVRLCLACLTKLRILNIIVSHSLRNKSHELEAQYICIQYRTQTLKKLFAANTSSTFERIIQLEKLRLVLDNLRYFAHF